MLVIFVFEDVSAREHHFVVFVEPLGLRLVVLVLSILPVEIPKVEALISTARYEASIIFKPLDVINVVVMLVKVEMGWRLHRVELIYEDTIAIVNSKQMTAISELDLLSILDFNGVIILKYLVQDVKHLHTVLESDNNVQSRWVKRKALSWLVKSSAKIQTEVVFV
jgi:hypothetical protein